MSSFQYLAMVVNLLEELIRRDSLGVNGQAMKHGRI